VFGASPGEKSRSGGGYEDSGVAAKFMSFRGQNRKRKIGVQRKFAAILGGGGGGGLFNILSEVCMPMETIFTWGPWLRNWHGCNGAASYTVSLSSRERKKKRIQIGQ